MTENEIKGVALNLARELYREDWYDYSGAEIDVLLSKRAARRPGLANDYLALRAVVLGAMAAIIAWSNGGATGAELDNAELDGERELVAQQA